MHNPALGGLHQMQKAIQDDAHENLTRTHITPLDGVSVQIYSGLLKPLPLTSESPCTQTVCRSFSFGSIELTLSHQQCVRLWEIKKNKSFLMHWSRTMRLVFFYFLFCFVWYSGALARAIYVFFTLSRITHRVLNAMSFECVCAVRRCSIHNSFIPFIELAERVQWHSHTRQQWQRQRPLAPESPVCHLKHNTD